MKKRKNKKTRKQPFTVEDVLQDLYKKIPSFKCNEGCVDCCGIVPWAGIEWEKVKDKREHTMTTCPYAVNGKGCEIYENRPFVCRMFGTEDRVPCPHHYRPDQLLTDEKAKELIATYKKIIMITGLFINGIDCSEEKNAMMQIVGLLGKLSGNVEITGKGNRK